MNINWQALLNVAVTTVVGAVVIVTVFALATRGMTGPEAERSRAIRVASVAGYVAVGLAVAYSIWLIVPYFHR